MCRARPRRFLEGFVAHLDEAAIGSIREIFDAQARARQLSHAPQSRAVGSAKYRAMTRTRQSVVSA